MSDDLKKLAEAYPKLQETINQHDADYGDCDGDDDCPLRIAASLHASNRALHERIVKLRDSMPCSVSKIAFCREVLEDPDRWCDNCHVLEADDDAAPAQGLGELKNGL